MQLIFLSQDDRFNIRPSAERIGKYPAGAFSTTGVFPVYALRVDGEGEAAVSRFLVPGADGGLYWVPMDECRIIRR